MDSVQGSLVPLLTIENGPEIPSLLVNQLRHEKHLIFSLTILKNLFRTLPYCVKHLLWSVISVEVFMTCEVVALAESVLPKIGFYVKSFAAISPYDLEDYRQDVFVLAAEAVELASQKTSATAESIFWQKFIFHTKHSFRSEVLLSNPDDIELFRDNENPEEKLERLQQEQLLAEGMHLATLDMTDGCRNTWYHLSGLGDRGKLSLSEIAEAEGVSMSTVRTRISRTHDHLVGDLRYFLDCGSVPERPSRRRRKEVLVAHDENLAFDFGYQRCASL